MEWRQQLYVPCDRQRVAAGVCEVPALTGDLSLTNRKECGVEASRS